MNILDQEHDEEQQGGKPPAEEEDIRPDAPESEEDESEEAVEWDGSEAELVLDDDAADYEEPQTGVKLSYTLREEEVFHALGKSGFSKTLGRRAAAEGADRLVVRVSYFSTDRAGVEQMVRDGKLWISRGASVAVFPEGTRSKDEKDGGRDAGMLAAPWQVSFYPDTDEPGIVEILLK